MSWLDRNEVLRSTRPHKQWPRHCQFTSAEVDDADLAELLTRRDTQYRADDASQHSISYIILDDSGHLQSLSSSSLENDLHIWKTFKATAKNIIVLTHFIRGYDRWSIGTVQVSERRWANLFQSLALPPSALELLYDNNGGSASRFSPCSSECMTGRGDRPCSYHIWLKPSNWSDNEQFIYARHDFHTHQNIIFCAATENDSLSKKLMMRLEQYPNCTLFHILYTYLSFCFYSLENGRWMVDGSIFHFELETGSLDFMGTITGAKGPALDELAMTKKAALTRDRLQGYVKAASILESIHLFTETNLHRYIKYDDSVDQHARFMPHGAIAVLSDSFAARITQIRAQLIQMQLLRTRIETQFDVITAVISQRDSQVNINLARSARADNELMKGIAFVTMVFLPATFFATFFSMTFFQIGPVDNTAATSVGTDFSASSWIWVYFACTVPLTVVLTWIYGLKDTIVGNWQRRGAKRVEQ